jgi:hypothetical protein
MLKRLQASTQMEGFPMFSFFKKSKRSSNAGEHAGHSGGHAHGAGCGGGHGHHAGGVDDEHRHEPDVPIAAHKETAANGSSPVAANKHHTHS